MARLLPSTNEVPRPTSPGGVLLPQAHDGHRQATAAAQAPKQSGNRTRLFKRSRALRQMRHATPRVGGHSRAVSGTTLFYSRSSDPSIFPVARLTKCSWVHAKQVRTHICPLRRVFPRPTSPAPIGPRVRATKEKSCHQARISGRGGASPCVSANAGDTLRLCKDFFPLDLPPGGGTR
jgi:hypothetical protein